MKPSEYLATSAYLFRLRTAENEAGKRLSPIDLDHFKRSIEREIKRVENEVRAADEACVFGRFMGMKTVTVEPESGTSGVQPQPKFTWNTPVSEVRTCAAYQQPTQLSLIDKRESSFFWTQCPA